MEVKIDNIAVNVRKTFCQASRQPESFVNVD
jgi:hypothetical protein